jgi:hypothetical protein
LFSTLCNVQDPIEKIVPHAIICKQDEFKAFIGTKIINEVNIHLPNDIKSEWEMQDDQEKQGDEDCKQEMHMC